MERREYYFAREFLNLPYRGSSAHIMAEVVEERGNEDKKWWEGITLVIGDCHRTVSFEISADPDHRENAFHKIDTLIEVLRGLRKGIEELAEARDRRNAND